MRVMSRLGVWTVGVSAAGIGALKSLEALAASANRRRTPPAGALPLPTDDLVITTDDGARLSISIEGLGPDVVLVHGWTADRAVWNAIAGRLVADGRRVIRADMRGHGRSTVGSGDLSMRRLVADLTAVLDAADVRDAVIMGHSLGSATAIVYLCEAGEAGESGESGESGRRIRAAVLTGAGMPDPTIGPRVLRVSQRVMRSPVVEWLIAREELGLTLMDPFVGREKDPAHLRAQRAATLATPAKVRSGLLPTILHDFSEGLPACRLPMVVVVGSDDRFARPARVATLAGALPEARFVQLHDRGHNLPFEAPDDLVEAVRSLG